MKMALKQKDEEVYTPNLDDPRNKTYWNLRGKVLRAWPHNDDETAIVDVVTGEYYIFTNIEIILMVNKGELVEIDPFKSMSLPQGGATPAKKVKPEPIDPKPEQMGSALVGKYANMSVIKRCIEQGIKVNTLPLQTPGHGETRAVGHTAPSSHTAPSASLVSPGEAGKVPGEASARTPLAGKYARKDK